MPSSRHRTETVAAGRYGASCAVCHHCAAPIGILGDAHTSGCAYRFISGFLLLKPCLFIERGKSLRLRAQRK